jgi:hypothetical protein
MPRNRGTWRETGPPAHTLVDPEHKIEWEVWFIALDSEADVAKLLSMDLSDAWVNEAREIPKAIIDGLMARVGRYPRQEEGGCANAQILLDTNPPDTDHWWYALAERDTSTERNRQMIASMDAAEDELRAKGVLGPGQPLMTFHAQPSGRSPKAENLANLRPGYYEFTMAGKSEDWIRAMSTVTTATSRTASQCTPDTAMGCIAGPPRSCPGGRWSWASTLASRRPRPSCSSESMARRAASGSYARPTWGSSASARC